MTIEKLRNEPTSFFWKVTNGWPILCHRDESALIPSK